MTYFLSIQNTYDSVEIALFRNEQFLALAQENKLRASKYFTHILKFLLKDNNLNFNDLSFLAVNQGPGPFTTLRVVIASVNGLSFASRIPLIGVDGLDALLLENEDPSFPVSVAILNAFNNDLYFAVQENGIIQEKGCKNNELFLHNLKNKHLNNPIRFMGNGIHYFSEQIKKYFNDTATISENASYASVHQIAQIALQQWQKKENLSFQLLPLYLKQTITA